jgi:hypothetical protein
MAGRLIKGAAALSELVRPASETDAPGLHRMLPVASELSALLPGRGLRRGSTIAVAAGGSGTVSLMLALLSAASRAGSWCAVIGVPDLGALAAEENGIALDRLALIPNPGPDWPTVAGALIDGVDIVVTAIPGQVAPPIAARLVARARQRGSVLMPVGAWPGADVTLRVTAGAWEGLTQGHGRLRRRRVTILARGRGAADRPRELTMWMPGRTLRPSIPPPAAPLPPLTSPGPSPAAPSSPGPSPAAPSSPGSLPAAPSSPGSLPAAPSSSGLSVSPSSPGSLHALPSSPGSLHASPSSADPSLTSAASFQPPALPGRPEGSAPSSPPGREQIESVVDLSEVDAADLVVTGLVVVRGFVPSAAACVVAGVRSGRSRGTARSGRPRAGTVMSRPPVRAAGRGRGASDWLGGAERSRRSGGVPVWWEFVPGPGSAAGVGPGGE